MNEEELKRDPILTSAGRAISDEHGALALPMSAGDPVARWVTKATAFANGWVDTFTGDHPSVWAVSLGLAVAQHETLCGDAWTGEHNWGGVQLGGLNAEEAACLTGIVASPQTVAVARETLNTHGLNRSGGALHVDSSPASGTQRYYFAWFAAFPTDEQGAAYFIKVLAKARASKAVLQAAVGAWRSDAVALASAMYNTHYYEGFHDPKTPAGVQANISDYAGAILTNAPSIFNALNSQGWTSSPGKPVFDFVSTMGVQSALTYLAGKLGRHDFDPLGIDGKLGPNTMAALKAFQEYAKVPVMGTITPATSDALKYTMSQLP